MKKLMMCATALSIVALGSCSKDEKLSEPDSVSALKSTATGSATLIDIDYSEEFSDAGQNVFIATVLRGDGNYETYTMSSEGNSKTLVATTADGKNGLMNGLVGHAFGPDVANKGNDFAFARDIGNKVQLWAGELAGGNVKYHQRNKFEVNGEFIDLDYSPEFSTPDYNVFILSVDDGGVTKTYLYSSEGSGPKMLVSAGAKLSQGLVGQAFGPDVANKGNDFAYARDIGSKVEFWIGEQKNNGVTYHQRRKFQVPGEFIDIDYSPEMSNSNYNVFIASVDNGGTVDTYILSSEGSGPRMLVSSGANLSQGLVGQAFGPDVANKGNDFRYARTSGNKIEFWIGEQNTQDVKYHQRGKTTVGN